MADQFIGSEEELHHYGVKGMKWGKQKGGLKGAISDSIQRRETSNRAIAEGKGTKSDHFRKASRGLGLGDKSIAKNRADVLRAQQKRLQKGKLTTLDKLDILVNFQPIDLVVSRRDRREDDTPAQAAARTGASRAGQIVAGVAGASPLNAIVSGQLSRLNSGSQR